MIEPTSQEIDDRMTRETLREDVMRWKHATATFWHTLASELLGIAAGGSDLKCLIDGRSD
jgi:hypothetical protein